MSDSGGLPGRLVEFAAALRGHGITVGTSETADAAAAITVLGLADRALLREGLSAAFLRRAGQRAVFDQLFDLYFPAATGAPELAREAEEDLTVEQFRALLLDALIAGDAKELAALAATAVDRFGELPREGEGWSAFRAISAVQPQTLLASAVQGRSAGSGSSSEAGSSGWDARLARGELQALIASFRERVVGEAARRQAEVRGRERMTAAVRPAAERVGFLTADAAQREALRRTVKPLARRLATRLATRRKRRSRGRIDIRRTLRRSMSTGGVPIQLALAKPRPTRPELVLLCDVSGSVSGFSSFTMLLVQAMKGQFSKIRVFAFVNATDDVTDLVTANAPDLEAVIHANARITGFHGSSDYGSALGEFVERYLPVVTSRSSVLILGDARTNYRSPNVEALKQIVERSRRTFWLNPERRSEWGTGDSVADVYATVVDTHECATVEQLGAFVSKLLPV